MFEESSRQRMLRRYLAGAVALCGMVTFVVNVIAPSPTVLAVLLSSAAGVAAGVSLLPGQRGRCWVAVVLAATGFVDGTLGWMTNGVAGWTIAVVTASNGSQAVIALVALLLQAKRIEVEDESVRQYAAYAQYAQTYHSYQTMVAQYPSPEPDEQEDVTAATGLAAGVADVRAKYASADSGAAAGSMDTAAPMPSADPAVGEFGRQEERQYSSRTGESSATTSAQHH